MALTPSPTTIAPSSGPPTTVGPISASPTQGKRPTVSQSTSRIDALDWTKGVLILFMVVYHAINYSAFRPFAYRFLAFLPPSFILITGFIVGQIYASKYDLSSWSPYLRLLIRGLKLLLLFLVLNIANCVILQRSIIDGFEEFAERSSLIFLSGNGRSGIFEVLLPIGYFLLLAPGLLWLRGRAAGAIPISAVAVFLLCCVLELRGKSYNNLTLLSSGIIGMGLGLIPIHMVNVFASRWWLVLPFYLIYRFCSRLAGDVYPVQMLGVCSSVAALYCCGLNLSKTSRSSREMVELGKYSLLGYLAQIALLRVVVIVAGGRPAQWLGVVAVGTVTTALLLVVIRLVHAMRQRHRLVDSVYRLVFA